MKCRKILALLLTLGLLLGFIPALTMAEQTESIIEDMILVKARPDFAFRMNLTNSSSGESSPIENDYYLSANKVTNRQYKAFLDETGHKAPSYWVNKSYPDGKADHPVLNVSHSDATAYCQWLSTQNPGWNFRLPTEAEWENAAMGAYYENTAVKYPAGSQASPAYNAATGVLTTSFNYNGVIAAKLFAEYGSDYVVTYVKGDYAGESETLGECISISATGGVTNWANHSGSATKGYFLQTDLYATISASGGYTTAVESYPANTLGLYDMAGNCWDLTSSVIVAQNGLESGVSCYAVRGGSWYATARSCTFYYRGEGRKDSPSATVGFRVAADSVADTHFTAQSLAVSAAGNLRYWLYTPKDAKEGMPLIVYLHGGSGKGDDLNLITDVEGFPKYLRDGQLGDVPAYVVMPQLSADQTGWTNAGAAIMALISHMQNTYGVDATNVSLTGHSMGGTGTWSVALSYPATFARIAPLSGSIKNNNLNINKLKNISVRAYVGSADTIVDPAASQTFVAALQEAGGDAEIVTFQGATHFDVPALTYLDTTIGLVDWLIDKKTEVCATWDATGEVCRYGTLQAAMDAREGTYIRLLQNVQENVTFHDDLVIDLNGCSVSGVWDAGTYRVHGIDRTTDGYDGGSVGYMNCTDSHGDPIVPAAHYRSVETGAVRRYLAVQSQAGYSFHRFYLGITHAALRPADGGIGYRATFAGDTAVKNALDEAAGFGLLISAQSCPESLQDGIGLIVPADGFASEGMAVTKRLLVENIFREDISGAELDSRGQTTLYAVAFLQTGDGEMIFSQPVDYTLRQLVELTDSSYHALDTHQKLALLTFYRNYRQTLSSWDVPNMKESDS